MKTAIIYRSFLGSTKKYAHWLAGDISADVYRFGQANDSVLERYNRLIIMSGTYAAWMPLTCFLTKKWHILKNKKVIALSIGISPPGDPYTNQTLEKIPSNIRTSITIIRLPGSMFGFTPPETGTVKKENLKKVLSQLKTA